MKTKDPFANIPPVQPEPSGSSEPQAQSAAPNNFVESSKALAKGSAPRGIVTRFQKWAPVILFGGVLVWVFMPDNRSNRPKPEQAQPVVDKAMQVSQTSALLDSLKEEAKKAPEPPPPPSNQKAEQGRPQAAATPSSSQAAMPTPMQTNYGGPLGTPARADGGDPILAARLAAEKREEERRASPLEAPGHFVLAGEAGQAVSKSSNASQLEDEITRFTRQREGAGASVQNDTAAMLSSLTQPKQSGGSRNPSVEFLSSQGAAAGGQMRVVTAQPVQSPFMVHQGTVVRSVLLSEVSTDQPGEIIARVTSDVYDSVHQRYVLIPKGSKLIGVYNNDVVVGQERTLVALTRLIFPDGSSVSLAGASGSDMIGRSGLKAEVNNHFWKMFSSSFIVGASSFFLSDKRSSVQTTTNGTGSTTTGSVAGMALNDVIQTLMNRNKNIQPTLSNGFGQEFIFMVKQDMALTPFHR